jgi:DNA-binding transcriptional LysR family regulator
LIDFRSIETFVWVVQLKSFRRAAAKLNTTQPAVSLRIAGLERAFGVSLLNRERGRIAPTEPGRLLLDYAERLLRLRAEMIGAVADRGRLGGSLRLGVAETIVHTWLPRFIERMSATYPGIVLEIEVDISTRLREGLLGQTIDLAFLIGPLSAPTIRNTPLCTFPIAFLASPRLGLCTTTSSLADIAALPIITFARNTQPYVHLRELLAQAALPPARVHASASLATVVRMALDGFGIAVIPPSIVERELADGRLVELTLRPGLPSLNFVAGWLATPDAGRILPVVDLAVNVAAEPRSRLRPEAGLASESGASGLTTHDLLD